MLFFFNDTATTEIYTYGHTLSLHDALPICTDCIAHLRARGAARIEANAAAAERWVEQVNAAAEATLLPQAGHSWYLGANIPGKRSEEHTSELQSLMRNSYAVFCLKKQKKKDRMTT